MTSFFSSPAAALAVRAGAIVAAKPSSEAGAKVIEQGKAIAAHVLLEAATVDIRSSARPVGSGSPARPQRRSAGFRREAARWHDATGRPHRRRST